MNKLKEMVNTLGGARKVAKLIGVSDVTVYNWANGVHKIPHESYLDIESAYKTVVGRQDEEA